MTTRKLIMELSRDVDDLYEKLAVVESHVEDIYNLHISNKEEQEFVEYKCEAIRILMDRIFKGL